MKPLKRARLAPGSLALLGALLGSGTPLCAHDHWIQPSSFHPALGERVDVCLRVGHPGAFEEQIRDPRHFTRFDVLGPAGTKAVPGVDGKAPAGIFRPRDEGLCLLVFQSDHSFVEIEPGKYAEYLKIEALEEIQAERERRGETDRPGRDSFARFDKALVRVGSTGDASGATDGFDRIVGLPLELVLETDPFTWKQGDALVFRLEFEGQPLANRQVKLMRLTAPHTILLARTDGSGHARFTPEDAGGWVASTVHQRRAAPALALEGDWEGLWASYSCEIGSSALAGASTVAPADAH